MLIVVAVNTSGLAITSVNAGGDSRGCVLQHGHSLVDAVLVQVIIAVVGVKKEEKNLAVTKGGGR